MIAAAVMASAASFGPPPAAGPMPAGAATSAPRGFLDYCVRTPEDCGVDTLDAHRAVASAPAPWTQRFSAARQARPAPAAIQAGQAAPWSRRFSGRDTAPGRLDTPDAPPLQALHAVPLTTELWSRARKINTRVNRAIIRRDDRATYGVDDRWATPLADGESAGDCEDYALEKRRALIQAGVPRHALSLALVTTAWGESHAVLLLATDRGEYVLDSLTPWIVSWDQAPYRWRARQQAGRASDWVLVEDSLQRLARAD